jgi:outer membrane protein assembly factor BamB
VSPPHGRTELDRLNDIDAPVMVVGDEVFVTGYQGRAAMLALDSGQIWWTREVSSYRGVDVDAEHMYVSSSQGEVLAITRRTGQPVWANPVLKLRSLSAPVVVGEYVVVADLEGYVHWFDRATGDLAGRIKSGGDRVTNAPLAVADLVYVITDKGDIFALRGTPLASRAAKTETPPASEPAPAPAPGG